MTEVKEWVDEKGNTHYGEKINFPLKLKQDTRNIKVKLENSDQVEYLKQKVEDYEEKLTILSEQAFNKRKAEAEEKARKAGLSVEIENPHELKAIEKILNENQPNNNTGNRDYPLNATQLGYKNNKSVMNQEFSTVSDMVTALDAEETPESRDAVKKILRQTQRTGVSTFEFEGSLKKLREDRTELRKYKKVR
ncbi:MAG: hypothetical protein JW702_08960 [Clostridiales bacterium]|nr:hypothetical protein [Clostridiales bacterium]